jgi:peptidoglycan/xylan/chitin deacetylase (PgdA/CDA1 family)
MSEALLGWAGRRLFGLLSPAGGGGALAVMIFHRVLDRHDELQPGEPTAEEFEARMRWVRAWFNVLPLAEAAARLRDGRLPARALSITFDDGYADNHDLALPVLRRLGLPATFFVATGYLDGGVMFNDVVVEALRMAPAPEIDLGQLGLGRHRLGSNAQRRAAIGAVLERIKRLPPGPREETARRIAARAGAALPAGLMMSSAQVRALADAGMEVGAHTVMHPILASIDAAAARREIADGRARLEQITGRPVRLFAYPNGRPQQDYRREHAALVRELGFEAAVSTAWGSARAGADAFQLPRFTPWDRTALRYGLRLARGLARRGYAVA